MKDLKIGKLRTLIHMPLCWKDAEMRVTGIIALSFKGKAVSAAPDEIPIRVASRPATQFAGAR